MAKINIKFNNKSYSIDPAFLADATARLEAHLVAMMDEPAEPELGFPIAWNTMEVIDNASLPIDDYGAVKVSDYIPSIDEMANTIITVTDAEETQIFEYDETTDTGMFYCASYRWTAENKVQSMGICVFPTSFEADGFAAEAGLYATNFGSIGVNADCVLDIVPEERLEGDGAEYYTLAPTALSFRSTAPLNELQEIQINGVTVDPANYTLEEGSTIVTFPIDYLKTLNVGSYEVAVASDSKTVKGDFSVKAPELNEYGFYYNQPYTAYVEAFGGNTAVFIRNNGTLDLIVVENAYTETCNYTIADNQMTIQGAMGTFTASPTDNGSSMFVNELYTTFVLGDNRIASDADYIYIYKEDLGGYEVSCIDKTKAEYGAIKTGINGIDTVKIASLGFSDDNNADNNLIANAPVIPNAVTNIGDYAFLECHVLTSIELPASVTTIGVHAFRGCMSLTSIVFKGTTEQWSVITKGNYWNDGVPATYVQCSDGQVAL